MTTLGLDRLPGRCAHGFHVATQGCPACAEQGKARGQAIASNAHPLLVIVVVTVAAFVQTATT